MMLNKNTPRKSNFWKVGAVLPFIFIFIINFNVTTEAQVKERTDNPLSEITNDEEIAVTISKNTPKEALLMYQRIFSKRGTRLEFKNLQYSENDLLIAVSVSYNNSKTDETGQISLNNPEGIPSTIIYSGDKKTGFRQPKNSGQPEEVMSGSTLSKLGENPVFVIENEMYPSEKLYGKYIQVDGEMQILETMEAIQQYGAQAADGVIIVTKGKIISDFDASIKEIDSNPNAVKRNFIQIERGQSPSFISLDKKADHPKEKEESPAKFQEPESRSKKEDIPAIHRENEEMKNSSFEGKRPLIILEGEVKEEDFNLNSIDPNTIKSLSVLKGESALVKYGERAENGVVKIELLPDGEIVKEIEAKQSEELGRTPIPVTIITYDEPANNGSEVEIHNVQEADFLKSGALYIVDGKQKDENFDPATLDPNNIKNIDILKGAMAIEKYGEKGKHGVLEITMKKKSRI